MGRSRALAFAALPMLWLVGCDGEDESQRKLSERQFAALERVYETSVPLESLDDDASVADVDRALKRLARACRALPTDDPLLAANRRTCPVLSRLTQDLQAIDECGNAVDCHEQVQSMRRTFERMAEVVDATDKATREADLDETCEQVLLSKPDERRGLSTMTRAYAALSEALREGSDTAFARAERLMDEANRALDKAPAPAAQLRAFRAACR